MSTKLTARQQQIYDLIKDSIEQTGFPPTRAEIAQRLGFKSANAAEDHIKALAKKGAISLTAGASRGIRLNPLNDSLSHASSKANSSVANPSLANPSISKTISKSIQSANQKIRELSEQVSSVLLPVVGRVAAGNPILASENVDKELAVDPSIFDQKPDYLLKVKGQSMQDIGIMDGDLLAVKKSDIARNGQVIVARINDEVTVKRFMKKSSHIELIAENAEFAPIIVKSTEQFSIEGIAVGLIRTGSIQ